MIPLPEFRYLEPESLEEASRLLAEHGTDGMLIGGGTDLLPAMKLRIAVPRYIVSLGRIPGLDLIETSREGVLSIGPLVKLRSLETHPSVFQRFPGISQAARAVGSPQIREMGTVAGNINLDTRCDYYNQSDFWRRSKTKCVKVGGETCNATGGRHKCFAVFSGDMAPILISLGATVILRSAQGERTVPLGQIYSGKGDKPLTVQAGEILSKVMVPHPRKGTVSSYTKFAVRKAIDFPLASVAVAISVDDSGGCGSAKVVIGAVGPKPIEMKEIEGLLKEKKLTHQLIEEAADLAFSAARPVANRGSSPAYRREMVRQMVKKSLRQAGIELSS